MGSRTYPAIRLLDHAPQECRLVKQIPHTQSLEARHSLSRDTTDLASPSTTCILPHHFRVHTGQAQLTNIGYDDERSGKDRLVACLGTFDDLASQDDIERPGHTSRWDLVGVFLNTDFLPIGKLGSIDVEFPVGSVVTCRVLAHDRFGVLELLLNVVDDETAFLAREASEHEFRTDF